MDVESWILMAAGLALLLAGAELLVRGAARLAGAFGVPPLVIGLTVVAYGTSAPELAVSVRASGLGQADIALGNVVGSNIFNVLFILGLSALITPLVVSRKLVRLDVPIMIAVSLGLVALGWNGRIGRPEGALLVLLGIAYTVFLVVEGRREERRKRAAEGRGAPASAGWVRSSLYVAAGLALLVSGSRWLVDGAVALARALGTTELVIGLTVIAAGTSLPEVATSVVASLRGERDIAVGNVVGSNIFNVLWVLGVAALASESGVAVSPSAMQFDVPVMVAVAVACLPIFFTGYLIARWEGALFFAYYLLYTAFIVLAATGHGALRLLGPAVLWFALPLTFLTLGVLTTRSLRSRTASGT